MQLAAVPYFSADPNKPDEGAHHIYIMCTSLVPGRPTHATHTPPPHTRVVPILLRTPANHALSRSDGVGHPDSTLPHTPPGATDMAPRGVEVALLPTG